MVSDAANLRPDGALIAVIDIGKSRSKLAVLNADGTLEHSAECRSQSCSDGPYLHLDTDACWRWMMQALTDSGLAPRILNCVVVTHGAAFALLAGEQLAVPIMDYEFDEFGAIDAAYDRVRDRFDQSYSPALPAGLNAGRQIFFVQETLPKDFERVSAIVPYPQYWAARLSGVIATESTSLGSHTDLWQPASRRYSGLVKKNDWLKYMPPLHSAWDQLGPVLPEVATASGLNPACRIHCGIHDSNASYLRHLGDAGSRVCVVSTGTWVVCMAGGESLAGLDPARDMLANVDVFANPIPCARFMGGREYEVLTANAGNATQPTLADAIDVMSTNGFALPSFTESGGPLPGNAGELVNAPSDGAAQRALASLYCALITDVCLDKLGASGELVIEGRFVQDMIFIEALTHFRAQQTLRISDDDTGTVRGAARLLHWPNEKPALPPSYEAAGPASLYVDYRDRWRDTLTV